MMPQCEKMLTSPQLEGQPTTSPDSRQHQDYTCETLDPQKLMSAREYHFPLQSGRSQWLTPERNGLASRDSSTDSRHNGCSSNSSNDEPSRIRLHTWAEERALIKTCLQSAASGACAENYTLPEAASDRAQLLAAQLKFKSPSKESVTNPSRDEENLSQNEVQRTRELAFAGGGMQSPKRTNETRRLAFAPTPLRKRRTEEVISEAAKHTKQAGSGPGTGAFESRHGDEFPDPATKASQPTETVPQALVAASFSSIDPAFLSVRQATADSEETLRLPSTGTNPLPSATDGPDGICSLPHSRVCMFNIGTPREDAPQTPTGNIDCGMSCQQNKADSLEGDTEKCVVKSPARRSQCRRTRWSRGLPIASCDLCRTPDFATVPSLSDISDCRHSHQSIGFSSSNGTRWRNRGSTAFKASMQQAASAEDSSGSKHSDMPMACSNTLPTSSMQPAVRACEQEMEALQEDLAQRAKRFTELLRSCGTVAAAMDGGSTSSLDSELVEETKHLERVITQLLMVKNTQERRVLQVAQEPCCTHARLASQGAWQDASPLNDRFDTLFAGSPLPFCAPSTGNAFSVSNEEATACASGSVETQRYAARVGSPRSWAALTSSFTHMSPRTPRLLPPHERASSTHASPMFGTNLISQLMSPTCSGPQSKAELSLPEQQRSGDWVVAEPRMRRWGSKSNRPPAIKLSNPR